MKWYCVFSNVDTAPIEWEKLVEADVIYTFSGALRHLLPERCRGKVLVVFLDKLYLGRSLLGAIELLNRFPADVFLAIPPSKQYAAEIKATRRLAGVIERGSVLPWVQCGPTVQRERRFLHFARTDPRFEGYVKGTDYVLDLLPEFPHDIIGDVNVGHFRGWVSLPEQLALQRSCRLLLHPSRLDSNSRTLTAAIGLDQVSVLALREAEYTWSLSFGEPPKAYLPQFFPIARNKQEYQELVRRLMRDDDLYESALANLRSYKDQHRLFWDTLTVYQAFAAHGLHVPRDLTPLHHLLVTRELLDALPAGPWKENGLALNYV